MRDDNKIIQEYQLGKSMNQLSKETGVPLGTINWILMKNEIPKRSISQAVNSGLTHKDKVKLSYENQQILIGNLLGDGCVLKKKLRAFYSHTDKYIEYLEWLAGEFEKDGLTFSPTYQNTRGDWALQSHTYSVFNEYREKFYIGRKRIVPHDTILTPIALRQWYISDGSVATHGGRTISKQMDNPQLLLKPLRAIIGEEVSYHSQGKFYIPVKLVDKFLRYIGNCPTECYEYKWS